jgi:hypothetical protein
MLSGTQLGTRGLRRQRREDGDRLHENSRLSAARHRETLARWQRLR